MNCTKRIGPVQWEQHHWRTRITGAEIMTADEPDMWARAVVRDYVRCDMEVICDTCGTVRRRSSCMCDRAKGERCRPLIEYLERTGSVLT
jgi:hypothetical protein